MSEQNPQISKTSQKQAVATDPELSIWVSANAGSGKTYVLSRRVIRLLLDGNRPDELLCLTFTKTAAAEMSNRVFEILGKWAMLPDDKLKDAITELTGEPTTSGNIARARKLFAIALDTPGGLRIQTIHAFCESLLHQFPLEANIPGHFDLMDDLQQASLLEEARKNIILASFGSGIASENLQEKDRRQLTALAEAYSIIQDHESDQAIDKAILQLIYQRDDFLEWLRRNGGESRSAFKSIWKDFSLSSEMTKHTLMEEFFNQSSYKKEDWEELKQLASAKKSDAYKKLISQIDEINATREPEIKHALRCQLFFTTKLERRKSLVHASFLKDELRQQSLFEEEQDLLLLQLDRIRTLETLKASQALFTIVDAILIEYARLKQKRSLLDFNDLISKTANLLGRQEISAWIQYKLDNGISHVLVDEAQDTSPMQWQIIEQITSEFYAGKGAREKIRTLFVVGDEKQSIYSFQGADPKEFNRQFQNLRKKSREAQLGFEPVPLNVSFRSTEEVLSAVDQVFSLPENARGLNELKQEQVHSANRLSDRGEVILWPPEIKPAKVEKTDWRKPPDEAQEKDAEVRLANKIANTIKTWIDKKERLPGRDEPIRFGDILILVRKRDRFVGAMNRALKQRGLNAAGADRLKLIDHIAIEDMIALGRFASMVIDDLSLAGLLKSPLFDFTEDELFLVCHKRESKPLFRHLIEFSDGKNDIILPADLQKRIEMTVPILKMIRQDARHLSAFDFFARFFAKTNLRKKYHARLGHEAEEILNGFLQSAMEYDNREGLGLQGFIESLATSEKELKREIDLKTDEIRVITVHSSKGLEAPIVFLVDPGSEAYHARHDPPVIKYENAKGKDMYLWQPKKGDRIEQTQATYDLIREAGEEEYRRLLYVGMTRAADRLIICGYQPEKTPTYLHWYKMVENGLSASPCNQRLNGRLQDVTIRGFETPGKSWIIDNPHYKKCEPKSLESAVPEPDNSLPDWVKPVANEAPAPRPLSPSGVLELLNISEDNEREFLTNSDQALERGNAVHHLLQLLPDVREEIRANVIDSYFSHREVTFEEAEKISIREMVNNLINDPSARWLFSASSKSEVDITGRVEIGANSHMVRGKIDRLVITPEKVVIADYKTNRIVPQNTESVSQQYLAQMALYRALLRQLYPTKVIECFLIWTQDGSIMQLTDSLLDHQMNRIARHSQKVVRNDTLTEGLGDLN